jgi:nucleoside-diphosphate-sugar epimerase
MIVPAPSSGLQTEVELEAALSEPTPEVIETLRRPRGDIILLGAGGKMGLSLARMARRASDAAGIARRVIGVSRFSGSGESAFQAVGIETIRCDLLNDDQVERLPDAENVIFMTGKKFGSSDDTPATWAMNSYLPAVVCRKFRRSRIVAFSTGNIYGLTPVARGGSLETDIPEPVGEYAMSCLGRERMFEYFSRSLSIPLTLVRLNYACDLRYGVLVDLARQVWSGQPIDLTMGHFNTIWQGDANAFMLRALDYVEIPPSFINVTGPQILSVRAVCEQFGRMMEKPVCFTETESDAALLADSRRAVSLFGPPRVSEAQLVEWVARWVMRGGSHLGKPTHFESRSGRF